MERMNYRRPEVQGTYTEAPQTRVTTPEQKRERAVSQAIDILHEERDLLKETSGVWDECF